MPIVEVQGMGEIEFPDSMSQEEIKAALQRNFGTPNNPPVDLDKYKSAFQGGILENNPITDLVKNFGAGALNAMTGTAALIADPAGTLIPGVERNYLSSFLSKLNPYDWMGVKDQPFTTLPGAIQLAGELAAPAPPIVQGVRKGVQGLQKLYEKRPSNIAKNLMEKLSGGAKNPEESARALRNHINDKYKMHSEQAKAHYDYPLSIAGDEKIYKKIDPLVSTKIDDSIALNKDIADLNLGDIHSKFVKNPSFKNAHKLQSELGVAAATLEKNPSKTYADRLEIDKIENLKRTLQSHIGDFLKKRDQINNEQLLPSYKLATDLYRENVVPYLANKELRLINREGQETLKNLHNIFDTPTNYVKKDGTIEIGAINKILSELPPEARNNILFGEIGAMQHAKSPKGLLDALKAAENNGYSTAFTPEVTSLKNMLEQSFDRMDAGKNALKTVGIGTGTLGTGAALLKYLGGEKD